MGSIPASAGERSAVVTAAVNVRGLSPRARGNELCAGYGGKKLRVYPRERGGTSKLYCSTPLIQGLSPRARGNGSQIIVGREHEGSIPASAGERAQPGISIAARRVYPRERGGTVAAE